MVNPILEFFDQKEIAALVHRMELLPQLVRRHQEELIVEHVPLPAEWLEEQRQTFAAGHSIGQLLEARGWDERDLDLHLCRPEALRRFARQRFGPGLEEAFLASRGGRDQVIYSLLRVRDAGLARELWIRIEEGEQPCQSGPSARCWRRSAAQGCFRSHFHRSVAARSVAADSAYIAPW